uniref:Uncharacterized protein n=1 Tax=Amphimedon queenslandica TaxID=400682 RepID=A0A1X7TP17_AMPQE
MQMEGVKKAARNAIRVNNHALSSALKKSPTYFQPILEKFAAQKPGIISEEEKDSYLDTYSGQSLQFRAGQLVASLQATVGVKPSTLDDILCILHENGAIVVQEAAKKIAKDYGLKLPKYDCLRSQKKTSRPIPAGNTETRVANEVANDTIATDDSSGAEEPDSPPVSNAGEERQLNCSDDGGQLRQRPSAAPSNESSGTEGADKPPPPSNPSSS